MSQSMRITVIPSSERMNQEKKSHHILRGYSHRGKRGRAYRHRSGQCGVRTLYVTEKMNKPRGIFCGQGRCGSCRMIVDGVPDVKTCSTPVKDGMRVQVQHGLA